jgi:lysophospholipase L1-like esterase
MKGIYMRTGILPAALAVFLMTGLNAFALADDQPADAWRTLPLIQDGKVDPAWVHIGYGGFAIEDGSLRTECSEKGLGLLVYGKEKFGDCQIRVVYRSKDAKSNAGVYVRIDDGILKRVNDNHAPAIRDARGNLTNESMQVFMDASEKERGPWYAVHHGYEVQICDAAEGKYSRTGAVYSLAESATLSDKPPTEWKTMIITLKGNLVLVDIDGKRVTTFDPDGKNVPATRAWYEPKREPKRPTAGYIGLQNHDPGDVVYFKEVSVRPLASASVEEDAAAQQVTLKKGDKIIFFGDSLTSLAGEEKPKEHVTKGYVRIVRETLQAKHPDKGIEVDWVATGGHTVPDLLKRVDADVISKKPTIVVIQIGCNDARRVPKATFQTGLEQLIDKLQSAGIQVVQCSLTSVGEKHDGTNKDDPKLDEFAAVEREIAKAKQVPLNDLRKAFVAHWKKNNPDNKPSGILTYDGNHFNQRGMDFVAEQMLSKFK